jgi:hypothetical protein
MDSQQGSRKQRGAGKGEGRTPGTESVVPLLIQRCQECHRAGSVRSNAVRLCEECDAAISEDVHERVRTIQETLRKLKQESGVQAKLRRWDLILVQAETLLKYEEREILTTCPPPSTLLQDFRALRDAIVRTE